MVKFAFLHAIMPLDPGRASDRDMIRHLVRVARGYGGPYASELPDAEGFHSLDHLCGSAELTTQYGWHLDRVLKGIRAHADSRNLVKGPRFVLKCLGGPSAWRLKTRPHTSRAMPDLRMRANPREPDWHEGAWFRLNRTAPQGTRLVLWNAPPMEGTHSHIIHDMDAAFQAISIVRSTDRVTAQILTPAVCPLTGPHSFINLWGGPDRVGRGGWEQGTGISLAELVVCPSLLASLDGNAVAALPPVDPRLMVAEYPRPPSRPPTGRQSPCDEERSDRDPGLDSADLPV